jgi:hypothetical protein
MQLFDRLTYAAIGFVFGSLIGMVCWFLAGFRPHSFLGHLHFSFFDWIKYSGGLLAVVGFIFRENVGSLTGEIFSSFFDSSSDTSNGVSRIWGGLIFALLFGLLFLYFQIMY